jgi:site-specific DNA-methyltransferase (adenine-specific)
MRAMTEVVSDRAGPTIRRVERLFLHPLAEIWRADSLSEEEIEVVMGPRKANALIFDAPYSDRTHIGHRDGKMTADRAAAFAARHADKPTKESRYAARKSEAGESGRRDIDYAAWSPADVDHFVELWRPRFNGWIVSITDDVLAQHWRSAYEVEDMVTFATLPLVETGSRVRMTGDGPSAWSCFLAVARPRSSKFAKWGTLPGCYIVPGEREQNSKDGTDRIVGGKPKRAMIEIVGDYSREGDLVVDPTCGAATTGIACVRTGRRFIGIEKDPQTAELAAEIMKAELCNSTRRRMVSGQRPLFELPDLSAAGGGK